MTSIAAENKLQYNFLGNSGLRVSNICLGAMTFGEFMGIPNQLDESSAHAMINRFVEWGGNFIDTANYYGKGNSEKIIGTWLSGRERDRFVLATKCRANMDPSNPNAVGLGRRHMTHALEQSLKRLQTDYVDLYQTHVWDDCTPLEETLRTLDDLVRCGKVRYVGASNVTGWQMQKIVDLSSHLGLDPFISLQQQYSLLSRESEPEAFTVCRQNGLGVLPWSPLKGGFLTGKVKRGVEKPEGRMGWVAEDTSRANLAFPSVTAVGTDRNWTILDTVQRIASAKGKSPAQVSLRWLLQKPVVSSVIIGASKMSQLDDNCGAGNGWAMTPDEMKELDEVSRLPTEYPYNMIQSVNQPRLNPWCPPRDVTSSF